MEQWVLDNVEYLAKEYAIYFTKVSQSKPKPKEPSPTKLYDNVTSKIV
jgi:hypothetical protein